MGKRCREGDNQREMEPERECGIEKEKGKIDKIDAE